MKKRFFLILMCALLALALCACGSNGGSNGSPPPDKSGAGTGSQAPSPAAGGDGNTLFDKAAPGGSLLGLSHFDGESGYAHWIDNAIKTGDLLKELSAVDAEAVQDWTAAYPMYGMEIGTSGGEGLRMLWTNGYLITRAGEVYRFDYDFGAALKELEQYSVTGRELTSVSDVTNSYYLALRDGKWNTGYLGAAGELTLPEGVSMTLKEATDTGVTVTLKNDGKESWLYGVAFSLQVKLNGEWYTVPMTPDKNWAFISIGYGLEPGGSVEKTYDFGMYGDLPAGTYRIVVENLSAEFEMK